MTDEQWKNLEQQALDHRGILDVDSLIESATKITCNILDDLGYYVGKAIIKINA